MGLFHVLPRAPVHWAGVGKGRNRINENNPILIEFVNSLRIGI
jgi:hypothetical protein